MEIQEIKTATITSKGQICIPASARNLPGFGMGAKITITVYPDKVELKPLNQKKIDDTEFSMLASRESLAENWLSEEDEEAWKDL